VDISDADGLKRYGLHEAVCGNIELFREDHGRAYDLNIPAISPLTSDPYGHSSTSVSTPTLGDILSCSEKVPTISSLSRTASPQHTTLSAIFIPALNLVVENRFSWHLEQIYHPRAERLLPRITSYFDNFLNHQSLVTGGTESVLVAIGNKRIGDFLMQLAWLGQIIQQTTALLPQPAAILIHRQSDFFDLKTLFPELTLPIFHVSSFADIERYAYADHNRHCFHACFHLMTLIQ